MMSGTNADERSLELSQALEEEFAALFGGAFTAGGMHGSEEERLRRLFEKVHQLQDGPRALCLSGGGIRSATFSLGVLQGLARLGCLQSFHYLSTVSGGGYIGSWLTALGWHLGGIEAVEKMMRDPTIGTTTVAESPPVDFLRDYSNYLTPRLGLFSADTWAALALVLRNLLLMWLVLLPALALALLTVRLGVEIAMLQASSNCWGVLTAAALGIALTVSYVELDLPSAGDRRWPQWRFLVQYLLPLLGACVLLVIWWVWNGSSTREPEAWIAASVPYTGSRSLRAAMVLFGIISHLLGFVLGRVARLYANMNDPWRGWPTNWLKTLLEPFIVTAVGAAGGWLMWLLTKAAPPALYERLLLVHCDAVRRVVWLGVPGLLLIWVAGTALYVGFACRWTSEEDFEWFGRAAGWVLLTAVGWFVLGSLVLFLPHWVLYESRPVLTWLLGAVGGAGTLMTLLAGHSSSTAPASGRVGRMPPTIDKLVTALAAPAATLFLLALVTLGSEALERRLPDEWVAWTARPELARLIVFAAILGGLLLLANLTINVNRFSLHAMYRNRLVRAFLGSTRRSKERRENPFTGFDRDDDRPMRDFAKCKPLLVVNTTLNLVKGKRLAWQHRKAESFTISPLHCGSSACGKYRPTDRYGKQIKLGTAMAISGAAVSPNMGYHSSPLVGLLMTLFNVRLGWWLGNPTTDDGDAWKDDGPVFAIRPIIAEALGLTDNTSRYVYLSDGGHFENLGLYEMVLRRCQIIVVVDGSCDGDYEFEDLGNAVRKIKIDLGIPIELLPPLALERDARRSVRCYFGAIRYTALDERRDGVLIYLKPALTGDEPADVRNYAFAHPAFPHETTADQWFDEPQFESYRSLGEHTIYSVFGQCRD